jgi:hypothetical protein
MEYLPNKHFLSTLIVGAEFLVDECIYLCTPSVGAACIYVGVRDLDLGSMINLSTRVNKTLPNSTQQQAAYVESFKTCKMSYLALAGIAHQLRSM